MKLISEVLSVLAAFTCAIWDTLVTGKSPNDETDETDE